MAVSADSPLDGQKLALEMKLDYPIVSDNSRSIIKLYGVLHPTEGIARPSMFLLNKQGRIVWQYIGQDANDRPKMETIMKEIAAIK